MKTLVALWLSMLLGFLRPAVEDPVDPADPADPADAADPDPADPQDDLDPADPDPDPPRRTAAQDLEDSRREAREARERADRFERELTEARRAPPPPAADAQRQREDAILNDPNADANEKWRINANRRIAQTEQAAAHTLMSAQDTNDRSEFTLACASNPRLAAVKDDVERELATMRGKGQNAPRRELARYLLGKKLEEAPAAKKKPDAPNANRGRPANAGSDVQRGGGRKTEHQKRADRLANVNI